MSSAIPEGSIVLVTGVNGYISSHTADQLLSFGYIVRGTVRDASRCQWVQKFFDEKYGKGRLEIVVVAQISADGAFDEAVKGTLVLLTLSELAYIEVGLTDSSGVSGIVHVASDVSFSPDPNAVIPQTIASTVGILNSAIKEPSVKRVVYTSSSSAASPTIPNIPFEVTVDSWNDEASKIAWAPPPYTPDRAFAVYAASKLESEKACWKFMEEKRPAFEFNAVLPSGNFGPALGEGQSSPSFVAIRTLIQGDLETARKYGVAPRMLSHSLHCLMNPERLFFPHLQSTSLTSAIPLDFTSSL